MNRITLVIHPRTRILTGPLTKLAPSAQTRDGEDPVSIAFLDPDGEAHVYPLGEETRQKLVAELTGGVAVPPQETSKIVLP